MHDLQHHIPWETYSYLRLLVGIAHSPDIFQAKMSMLIVALNCVTTYLDKVLCITRGSLDDHLQKLKEVLTRVKDAGLKFMPQKSNFVPKKPNTLGMGYALTTDGIKAQPKKAQVILA
jgi:hypothetical protein